MFQGENFTGSVEEYAMQRKSGQEGVDVFIETGLTPRQLLTQRAELLDALNKYEEAREVLFVSCLSNGIFNAWGGSVDCTALNDAHYLAEKAITNTEATK